MRSLGTILFFAFCLAQTAVAQVPSIKLDGEIFSKQFIENPSNGEKLIEFVRETEAFEKWTKIIGVRYQQLPRVGNDPKRVALVMAQIVKDTNPEANSRVIANESSSEAIIDFLTWPPSGEYLEFNVFRYVKSKDGNGVVSVQFAKRFTSDTTPTIDQFKSLQRSWVSQVTELDMTVVHDLLGT